MFVDASILDRHERIALQFSGGKDSLAVWGLLRPHLDRLTVYHVDTGDQLPETQEIIRWIEERTPRFKRIFSDSVGFRLRNGIVSDLVPATAGDIGIALGMSDVKMCGRLYCCWHNQMLPANTVMEEDEVTLVIRGTKARDMRRLPHYGGETAAGYELWLPLKDWSDAQVFAYLREQGLPVHTAYETIKHSLPDCATCTAWWSDERGRYLKEHAPGVYELYRAGLDVIAGEIGPLLRDLQHERGT